MLADQKVVAVMPGLNVASTLERTVRAIPEGVVDVVLLVDDGSTDDTVNEAARLGIACISHAQNLGYGAAQKTGYREALALGADVAVLLHPDFQYKPELVPPIASMVIHGGYDIVLAARVLVGGALAGGMPRWKYAANRFLTWTENALIGASFSEYHTGYRAYSRAALERLPMANNRNDYAFDSEVLAQAVGLGLSVGEISCPAHYFDEMQTITFGPGVRYGLGCLQIAGRYAAERLGVPTGILGGPTLDAWTAGTWALRP
ncbi:MAG: glycosyltransferase family 2 protein [Myxococcota bacterium]